jgi:hypothetical protein
LEAFEDQVTLGVLEFSDLFFLFQLVVLHGGWDIISICVILRMEHMGAQVQDCLLVVRLLVALTDLLDAEYFHELTDLVDKLALLDALSKPFFGEVTETYQQVDKDRVWEWLRGLLLSFIFKINSVDEVKKSCHDCVVLLQVVFKLFQSRRWVKHVGEKCRGEIEAEWVHFFHLSTWKQVEGPLDHVLADKHVNCGVRDWDIDGWGCLSSELLQNCNIESLSYTSVFEVSEALKDLFNNLKVLLLWLSMANVVDTLLSTGHHGDESWQSVLQLMAVHVEHWDHEVKAFGLNDIEEVNLDKLANKVAALVGWDLEGIDSQTQQYLCETCLWLLLARCINELALVILEVLLREQECSGLGWLIVLQLE